MSAGTLTPRGVSNLDIGHPKGVSGCPDLMSNPVLPFIYKGFSLDMALKSGHGLDMHVQIVQEVSR
jgi:hypothetical protein